MIMFTAVAQHAKYRTISIFFLLVVLFETIITYYWKEVFQQNYIPYNYYALTCALFYQLIFLDYFRNRSWIRWAKALVVVWAIFAYSYFLYFLQQEKTSALPYNIGLFIASIFIIRYFYSILYEQNYIEIKKEPLFYFSLGILIFYTCCFPLISFLNILISNPEAQMAYAHLLQIGNIFLSLGYLGSAICMKLTTRSIISY